MAASTPDIEVLGFDDLKKLTLRLLEEIASLKSVNTALCEEIARLKGLKGRPKLPPSGMEAATGPEPSSGPRRSSVGELSGIGGNSCCCRSPFASL
jgi:hypothetical protein